MDLSEDVEEVVVVEGLSEVDVRGLESGGDGVDGLEVGADALGGLVIVDDEVDGVDVGWVLVEVGEVGAGVWRGLGVEIE